MTPPSPPSLFILHLQRNHDDINTRKKKPHQKKSNVMLRRMYTLVHPKQALVRRGHRVMSVIPMYYHYDECGTPCARVSINVCGCDVDVDYFHVHRDGVDLVFVSHPCFYEASPGGTTGGRYMYSCNSFVHACMHACMHECLSIEYPVHERGCPFIFGRCPSFNTFFFFTPVTRAFKSRPHFVCFSSLVNP